ncbi:amino acid adenylation domain-containing protein [Leptothoe sp. EHU-05/26/07-4]
MAVSKNENLDLSYVGWDDTAREYPCNQRIHQLFETQVIKTPDAIALVFGQQQLTYQQLNDKANQLAHYLIDQGVGPEVLVGLCLERSIDLMVGLLGILKAGGAYASFDPSYPQERLQFMVADTQVSVIVTHSHLLSRLPEHSAVVICLDTDSTVISQKSQSNPLTQVTPNNLAYIIYTSGSTGTPKGVMIEHQTVRNFTQSITAKYCLSSSDRVLQFASVSFDTSVEEIYPCWHAGATLVLRTEDMNDIATLIQKCHDWQITVLNLPTAYWHHICSQFSESQITLNPSLRLVIIGGEGADPEQVRRWLDHCGDYPQLVNSYGPTEVTVVATTCHLSKVQILNWQGSETSIGKPLAHIKTYILDPSLQPVPKGMKGELYVGGITLARGYLNLPELTTEKFIANPFGPGRLYKTGDLARYAQDGDIEYLGRVDYQVKVRGFRVELGEIETVLNCHPQVKQAVVITTRQAAHHTKIIAYFVASQPSPSPLQLREFLQQKLPEYMIPSAFVALDVFPLTPNRKVDRRALPLPDRNSLPEEQYIAPDTPRGEIIARAFAEVLDIDKVGIYDNFFNLGGHSLLAIQLVSRLRRTFEANLSIRTIFEAPTVTQLDQRIHQLKNAASNHQAFSIPRVDLSGADKSRQQYPLSWAQERLWFLDQLEGSSATYNISEAFLLQGSLDLHALQQALSAIVNRHEILRSSFQTVNGVPVQVIQASTTINIEQINLQTLTGDEQAKTLNQQIQQAAATPFNLEVAPLLRCSVFRLGTSSYTLLFTLHHIVSDDWSMGVMMQELSALYQAFCLGAPSPLTDLPIQYTDFAVWQQQQIQSETLKTQLQYWQNQLADAPDLLLLPTDRPRPAVQTYQGASQQFLLDRDLTQQLRRLSQQLQVTLFMILHSAFATLLYRYSGQTDILIGSPVANRNHPGLEPLIGFFVNTLVLRTRFENNLSFETLLTRFRETALQAYEHQGVPFARVVEALNPQRSLSHSPLFQVMFALQNAPLDDLVLPGITLSESTIENTISKFDLTLSITERENQLTCEWEYNTDLFDALTIQQMAAHFSNLLFAVVMDPQNSVSKLPLLDEIERHQALVTWNDTQCHLLQEQCIHRLFEAQVAKTPDAVAIVFEQEQLTYRQLNQKANRLAHYLQAQGVGPEVLVGICVNRSIDMVVALLGILKAGGAYVPLDPNHPSERLHSILTDAQVSLLVTQASLYKQFLSLKSSVVCLDDQASIIAKQSPENLDNSAASHNLAYVIYTSGSTGQPKGVQIEHKSVANLLCSFQETLGIDHSDRLAAVTTIAFDIATLEIYLPLISGAQLWLIPQNVAQDGQQLKHKLLEIQPTIMQATPATWQMLLLAGWDAISTDMMILCGGETLPPEIARQLLPRSKNLWNLYGPTETTVWSSQFCVSHSSLDGKAHTQLTIPIGSPIANTQVYILDAELCPVPKGVIGELYIGGMGVARGYLSRSTLTAEKFIPNPFGSGRLYKTGDLARYAQDGDIEYLGRVDYQVKVRGFRIELGEIETVLSSHPQVNQAVVITVEEEMPEDKRLVAYICPSLYPPEHSPTDLRNFLKQKLPDYMIPSTFVTLEDFPLNQNGKIDRKELSLLDIGQSQGTHNQPETVPRNFIEQTLAKIWQDLLCKESIGIQDNFFELGGHSLKAMRLMAQIQQYFQINLPLATLFQHPTLEELAAVLGSTSFQPNWSPLVPIQPNGSAIPLFCVPGAGGNVLYFYPLARHLGTDQPLYGLQAQGLDGETPPLQSIESIAEQYIQAIQTVQPVGPYVFLGHSFGAQVAFEMAQQLQRQGQSIGRVFMIDAIAPSATNTTSSDVSRQKTYADWNHTTWMQLLIGMIEELLGDSLQIDVDKLHLLTESEQIDTLKQRLEMAEVLPPQSDSKIVRGLFQVFRTQFQLDYSPRYTSPTPITLFQAQEASLSQYGLSESYENLAMGWQPFAAEEIDVYTISGSHASIMVEPHIEMLAQKILKSIEQIKIS